MHRDKKTAPSIGPSLTTWLGRFDVQRMGEATSSLPGTPDSSPNRATRRALPERACLPDLRGRAYLELHQGSAAAAEFQKFVDHKDMTMNSVLAGLAPLRLARSYELQGDTAGAHGAYATFLNNWKM